MIMMNFKNIHADIHNRAVRINEKKKLKNGYKSTKRLTRVENNELAEFEFSVFMLFIKRYREVKEASHCHIFVSLLVEAKPLFILFSFSLFTSFFNSYHHVLTIPTLTNTLPEISIYVIQRGISRIYTNNEIEQDKRKITKE